MIVKDWGKLVPGYSEAVEAETRARDIPFLGLTETINGVEVLPFCPAHFLILSLINPPSPFIFGGEPSAPESARFLWCVSPGFKPAGSFPARWRRWLFTDRLRRKFGTMAVGKTKTAWDSTAKAISEYVTTALPAPDTKRESRFSYFSAMASIVDEFASAYSWPEEAILKIPFRKLFQLRDARNMRENPSITMTNPSDRLRRAWVAERNARRN